jgi:conjugal transfer ATP-binding protein TraC
MYFSRRKKIVIIDRPGTCFPAARPPSSSAPLPRANRGAFMSATQGVDDYYRNPAATAALENSDWMFLLRQKPESIEMMDKLGQLTMDDAMKRLLQSLRTEHGAYSEVFIHSPVGSGVGRLIVDPHSLLLFSSRAEDFNAINEKREAGLTVSEAIDAVLRDRGRVNAKRWLCWGRQRAGSAALITLPVARTERVPAGRVGRSSIA